MGPAKARLFSLASPSVGAIAARFACDHDERLAGLVLVDALGLVPRAGARLRLAAARDRQLRR
jgi:pimeloyl-ACP methyl ester carboxylesterase